MARASQAQVLGVALRFDTNHAFVGGSTLPHVQAQILPAFRSSTEQIFSCCLDVLNTNGAATTANYDAMLKPASDEFPQTSSLGTADGANRRGIYDTFMEWPGAGRDNPVALMTIAVRGVAPGKSRFRVQAATALPALRAFLVATTGGEDSGADAFAIESGRQIAVVDSVFRNAGADGIDTSARSASDTARVRTL